MNMLQKLVEELTVSDLETFRVWQYVNNDSAGETKVRPIRKVPAKSLTGKIVGSKVMLNNREEIWAILGNIDANNPRLSEHFLTVSIERNGKWFTLSRYHDYDYAVNGPEGLATFLNLSVDQIFPINYDISKYAIGVPAALSGIILKEPREKLSRAEIVALAVP